jgi:hypothetical protein
MEKVEARLKRFKDWLYFYKHLSLLKDKSGKRIYNTTQSLFAKRILSSGIEGIVYKTTFTNKTRYKYKQIRSRVGVFITKALYLKRIADKKRISNQMIGADSSSVQKLFYSKNAFDKPSLIEVISLTLTNQLVFQKICPHFNINYDWNYERSTIRLYNEYATHGDFTNWIKGNHSQKVWLNALFQIMVGILAIQRYFNMIHTDLHIGNILVHRVKPGGYWTYIIDKKKYHVPNLGWVFLLSDFGFSWIPNKMSVTWHYTNILKYITKSGKNLYDFITLFKSLQNNKDVPDTIKTIMKSMFTTSDFIVFKKKYYKNLYNTYKNNKRYKKTRPVYKMIIKQYRKLYSNKPHKLSKKIIQNFYNKPGYTKPKGEKCIETYSLDKKFLKSKLPQIFRQLVNTNT